MKQIETSEEKIEVPYRQTSPQLDFLYYLYKLHYILPCIVLYCFVLYYKMFVMWIPLEISIISARNKDQINLLKNPKQPFLQNNHQQWHQQ